MTHCHCCDTEYTPLDDMRFRAGNWVDKDTGEEYGQICENCHRDGRCFRAK